MNKNLLHKTDKFFLDKLEGQVEIPREHVWEAVEKKLSEKENNKHLISKLTFLSISVLMIVLIGIPFLLTDINSTHQHLYEKRIDEEQTASKNVYGNIPNQLTATTENLGSNAVITSENEQIIQPANHFTEKNLSLAVITHMHNLNSQTIYSPVQLKNFNATQFVISNDIRSNETVEDKSASITIKLPQKHVFSIMPFFSIDHISGRLIEQYEFDNLTKNDYSKREKPDRSYTTGVLGSYRMNKKFSLLSGISFSSSMLSITSTAVNALRDAEGNYKFKLATSYGLAEISQPDIEPAAGDSLLVSGATMQFNYISFPCVSLSFIQTLS